MASRRRRKNNRNKFLGNNPSPSNSSKKKLSSATRLTKRLGKSRRVREEWNQAVKVLANTKWIIKESITSIDLIGTFGKTVEQFASIKMPCKTLEAKECTQVTMRLLQTYETLSNLSNDKSTTDILSQSLMVFCAFVRNVCNEQQAPFTSEQLTVLVPFLLPHVSLSSKHHAIDAMRTLSKVLLHNGERCTLSYNALVQALAHQITSEQAFSPLLAEVGDKTLRDCAMDCLSSLCLGASNNTTSKASLVEELKKGQFLIPLCIVIRSFVMKEDAEDVLERKLGNKGSSSSSNLSSVRNGKATSAWAALDDEDDDDEDREEENGNNNMASDSSAWERRSRTKHTATDIVAVTSTCRALVGLIAVLPSLGDSDRSSTQLITDLHRLSSFGVDDLTSSGSMSLSVRRVVGSSTAPKLRSWRTSRSEKFSARKQWNDSDSESDSGVSSASDTEASDAEDAAPIGQLCARLRLQALGCLQRISTHHSAAVHQKWTELIAENESEWIHLGRSNRSNSNKKGGTPTTTKTTKKKARSLLATSIFDPSSKVRTTAASVVCMMVESAPLNQWIGGGNKKSAGQQQATTPTRGKKRRPAFISMTTRISNTIVALHGGLFFALRRERMSSVVLHLLKCTQTLFLRLPYGAMPEEARDRLCQFVPELVRIIRTALRPNNLLNVPVATSALITLGNAFSTMDAIPAVQKLLEETTVVQPPSSMLNQESKESKSAETKMDAAATTSTTTSASLSTPPSTPPRTSKTSNISNTTPKNEANGRFVPPHRRRTPNSSKSNSVMCSPVPVIDAPDVPQLSHDILREIMSLCGGIGNNSSDGNNGSNTSTPLYPELPYQGLTVLAKISKRYPLVVLGRWVDVCPSLLRSISNVEERVRILGLNILTMLIQASALRHTEKDQEKAKNQEKNQEKNQDQASENKEELDVITFVSRHIPRAFKDTKTNVRAAVCGVLANVHVSLWCRLENNIREMFFQEILSKCNESKSPKVQSAGCMCLGRLAAVTEFSVNPSHVQQAFQILAGILGDKSSNQSVGARASWAFANFADVAGPNGNETRPVEKCPLSLLQKGSNEDVSKQIESRSVLNSSFTVVEATNAAVHASMSQRTTGNGIKLCSSAIRALGSLGQFWLKDVGALIVNADGDADKWMTLSENDPSIAMVTKVMETLSNCLKKDEHEKLLWNACHAVGRVLGAFGAYDVNDTTMNEIVGGSSNGSSNMYGSGAVENRASSATTSTADSRVIVTGVASTWIVGMGWYDAILRNLATIVATCPNFKVRIHAVQALGNRCTGRKDYGDASLLEFVLKQCIVAYTTMDEVMDPNMDYRFRLKETLSALIMRLTYMIQNEQVDEEGERSEGATLLLRVLSDNATLLHGLIRERDRASGLSMIVSDAVAMEDPSNAIIVQEACAVSRQYHRLAAQLITANSSPIMSVSKKSKSKSGAAWGDDDGGDSGDETEIKVKVIKATPIIMDSIVNSIQKLCAKRSMELSNLLGRSSSSFTRDSKEEKCER